MGADERGLPALPEASCVLKNLTSRLRTHLITTLNLMLLFWKADTLKFNPQPYHIGGDGLREQITKAEAL